MNGLLSDPNRISMLLNGLGLLTAKYQDQADQRFNGLSQGLIQSAKSKQRMQERLDDRKYNQPQVDATLAHTQAQTNALTNKPQSKRQTAKGADGYLRYIDDQTRVFPDVVGKEDPANQFAPFKDANEQLNAQSKIVKEFDDKNKIVDKLRDSFRRSTDIVNNRGGFEKMHGADDTLLMKSFANMILPTESVMSDDMETIAKQDGLPAWFRAFGAKVSGGGTLAPEERAFIYRTMTDLHTSAVGQYERNKASIFPRAKQTGLLPMAGGQMDTSQIFQDHAAPYDIPQSLLSFTPKQTVTNPKADPIRADSFLDKWFN